MESENIRRFLFIPLIVSLFLFHTQLFQVAMSWLLVQYMVSHTQTDLYIVSRPFSAIETIAKFLPSILTGLVVGLCFAALDYRIHRQKDIDGQDGIRSLLRNLFNSGALVWMALSFYIFAVSAFMGMWSISRRYHAYPPEMQSFQKLAVLPPFFIGLALLWSMTKTLLRYKPRKLSALSE